jgi:hypothetical protein
MFVFMDIGSQCARFTGSAIFTRSDNSTGSAILPEVPFIPEVPFLPEVLSTLLHWKHHRFFQSKSHSLTVNGVQWFCETCGIQY